MLSLLLHVASSQAAERSWGCALYHLSACRNTLFRIVLRLSGAASQKQKRPGEICRANRRGRLRLLL